MELINVFFDIFKLLCDKKGVSPKKAVLDMGLSNSLASKWKNTGATPSGETLNKIADYFGVTTDSLLGKESAPAEAEADEMVVMLENIRNKPGMRTLFSLGKNATPEQLQTYIDVIKAMGGKADGEYDS
jgi:repressor LexA